MSVCLSICPACHSLTQKTIIATIVIFFPCSSVHVSVQPSLPLVPFPRLSPSFRKPLLLLSLFFFLFLYSSQCLTISAALFVPSPVCSFTSLSVCLLREKEDPLMLRLLFFSQFLYSYQCLSISASLFVPSPRLSFYLCLSVCQSVRRSVQLVTPSHRKPLLLSPPFVFLTFTLRFLRFLSPPPSSSPPPRRAIKVTSRRGHDLMLRNGGQV